MPPRRKRNSAKNELDRLGKLAAKLGMNIDNIIEEVPLTQIGEDAVIRHQIDAESVLFYIETKGKGFIGKNCKNKHCGKPFLHTYQAVDYCSEDCRAYALAEMGIIWNFHRRSDSARWNVYNKGYVPKIIGVAATEALENSGHLYTELPEEGITEELEEEIEDTVTELPLQGIPKGAKGPVDEETVRAKKVIEEARQLEEEVDY